jgi:catalase
MGSLSTCHARAAATGFLTAIACGAIWPADIALAVSDQCTTAAGRAECVPRDEAHSIEVLDALTIQSYKARLGVVAHRGAHAKAHGCVNATFNVRPDLAQPFRVGLFQSQHSFDAIVRFSNGFRAAQDDHAGDGRGMAIKLLNVDGKMALAQAPGSASQDFVLLNNPVFFVRNAADYVDFTRAESAGRVEDFFRTHAHEAQIAGTISSRHADSVLAMGYFSMTPYRFGHGYAKYSTAAVACDATGTLPSFVKGYASSDPNYLKSEMTQWLGQHDACFEFSVQLQDASAAMPIEDPTQEWDSRISPFVAVADIRIAKQTFDSPQQEAACENLSYTPWHSLAVHEPVGGINRLRRSIYQLISDLRHGINRAPGGEPHGPDPRK